ncbi:MAG TPA: hypothetical protein VN370_06910 [Desulfitobacteriaceae bacterium]|nr:hypothetical protein [Desulfitobacteriaceae bacterium]
MVKDRLIAAGIAGIAGACSNIILGVILKSLHWSDRALYDYSTTLFGKMTYGSMGFWGFLMEIITDIALCIIWAIIFAYVIKVTSSHYYYIKGLGFGFVIWMVLTSLGTLFNIPLFTETPLEVAYTTLFTALVFGFVVAWVLKFIEQKTELV